MKNVFVIFFLLVNFSMSFGQSEILRDSSEIKYRTFNEESIAKYSSQKGYNYDLDPKYEQNPIKKWWYQIWEKLRNKIGYKTLNITWEIIKYGLIITGISVLLWFLLGSSKTRIFKRSDKSPDFHSTLIKSESGGKNLDSLIEEAELEEDYSVATSYLFLKTLRIMDRNKLISWRDFKTNIDYLGEISNTETKTMFGELSSHFEYVVYGEFDIDLEKYSRLKESFELFFDRFNHARV